MTDQSSAQMLKAKQHTNSVQASAAPEFATITGTMAVLWTMYSSSMPSNNSKHSLFVIPALFLHNFIAGTMTSLKLLVSTSQKP
ncbi:hypothetical protein ACHAW6_012941 [Cyclotella cf. meneghiniana]